MTNTLALMLWLAVSTNATAAWTKASESAAGTGYVDRDTIVRSGDNVKMWELTDYRIVPDRNNPYKSVKRQFEFDCKEKRMRVLSSSAYEGNMGSGRAVTTASDAEQWTRVIPSSVGHILWTIACNTRANVVCSPCPETALASRAGTMASL